MLSCSGEASRSFSEVALTIALGQGLLLWLLGRKVAHVSMSGVVFGFFGYLLAIAWFTRGDARPAGGGRRALFLRLDAVGRRPARNGTSWDGHLFWLDRRPRARGGSSIAGDRRRVDR